MTAEQAKHRQKMKRIIVIFNLMLYTLTSCSAQSIDLFYLVDLEENTSNKVGFISLSNIYPLSEHPDSLAIPYLDTIENKNLIQYFKLTEEYRKRFLTKSKISEADSVFIYDYSSDILRSFAVKNLNVAASLSIYRDINEYPLGQYDYQIGFEINKKQLSGIMQYGALAFVGKSNPFQKGQMKPIVWSKITSKEFPNNKISKPNLIQKSKSENSYLYNSDNYDYFVKDYTITIQDNGYEYDIKKRLLIVINKRNGKVIIERLFSDSEGTSVAPLNFGIDNSSQTDLKEQWIGKLFKDKPEVFFGFEWVSFGCPNIIFLNSKEKDIYINCDNRH